MLHTSRFSRKLPWFFGLVAAATLTIALASPGSGSTGNDFFWITLDQVASGFNEPTTIANAGDGRLFVVERAGVIRIIQSNGQVLPTPFLDIRDRVGSTTFWEQGLLGLAFHPDYAGNGFFFVNYTDLVGDSHIARFQVSAGNPDVADPASEALVLFIEQPTVIHNGGSLAFGLDGYLYAGLGDGGWLSDPFNRAQNPAELLGKVLRLDVSAGSTPPYYTIPPDNPFVGVPGAAEEIWALGFRNPWRLSFDRLTGDLFIGDVGNFAYEEVDFEPAGDPGGRNYGWRCYEGNAAFNLYGCGPASQYTFPAHAYAQEPGCAAIGGFVYRGSQFPVMAGYYIFGDFCHGQLWSLYRNVNGAWQANLRGNTGANISAFGEGANGELYAATYFRGIVYQLQAEPVAALGFMPMLEVAAPTPTPVPPGPDLVVADLTLVPAVLAAGEPVIVYVTVLNQGNQPVTPGNNFFVDFYVDTVPAPYAPGDLYWGAQGAAFGPGQSQPFNGDIVLSAGFHNLYVQVDTDQSVPEAVETNNIYGPIPITVEP
ncbi:MAG: PQQ-dependent sugar dehydrogenase [Chloroflexi bacterium]|nr:PQQ-dependent sugar dehydrogenase [Chloroflexota bacterium]